MRFPQVFLTSVLITMPLFSDVLMDDFEEGLQTNPFMDWYVYTDETVGGESEIISHYDPATDLINQLFHPGSQSDSCALLHYHLGRLLTDNNAYAAIGGSLKDTCDLTGATAVRFDIRADTDMTVYFKVATANITNHDYFASPVSVTETFRTIEIPLDTDAFSQLWSDGDEFDLTVVRAFEWLVDAQYNPGFEHTTGSLYIDNFTLIGDPAEFTGPPDSPEIVYPQTGAQGLETNPVLEWSAPMTASGYNLQVSVNEDYSAPFIDLENIQQPYRSIHSLATGTIFYWRVQAVNEFDAGAWVESHFTTNTPPESISLSAPRDTIETLTPELSWEEIVNIDYYELVMATDSQFRNDVISETVSSPSYTTGTLEHARTYYWRVYARNNVGIGPYSETWSFTTPASLSTPAPITPEHESTVQQTVHLSWNEVSGAADYQIQITQENDFSASVHDSAGHPDTSFFLSELPEGEYSWRVRAMDESGGSFWSPVQSFTKLQSSPEAPTPVSPEDGSSMVSTVCSLIWNPSAHAQYYTLQLSTESDFSEISLEKDSISDTSFQVSELENDLTYYWRVNALNTTATSDWSDGRSFTTIVALPLAPELVALDNDTLQEDTLVCRWYTDELASEYAFLLCSDEDMSDTVLFHDTLTDTSIILGDLDDNQTYWWKVKAYNQAGWGEYSAQEKIVVNRPDVSVLPAQFALRFNGASIMNNRVSFRLPEMSRVQMVIYDLKGRAVHTCASGVFNPGTHHVNLGARAAGKYFLSFKAGKYRHLVPFTSY